MSAISIAFKITALVLLLGILGIAIGVLIVDLNIRDDVEATVPLPTYPTTAPVQSTKAPPPPPTTTKAVPPPPPPTTTAPPPPPPCTTLPPLPPKTEEPKTEEPKTDEPKTEEPKTEAPVGPVDQPEPDTKNIPNGHIIDEDDRRYSSFAGISNLYEKWMNVSIDPCDDFYRYVCGTGQTNGEQSPFLISQNKNNAVESKMWKAPASYWANAPTPVKQVKWFSDKCAHDNSYTVADQEAQIRSMLQQFIDTTGVSVPFFTPFDDFAMDTPAFSNLIGYAKGQFGASGFLDSSVQPDYRNPDLTSVYIDQPLPIFIPDVYGEQYPEKKQQLIDEISTDIQRAADILGVPLDPIALAKMSEDVVELDKYISNNMQEDKITRRYAERNYNPYTLAELNSEADQFEWVSYVQSVLTLLGDKIHIDDQFKVIIMEVNITITKLNDHLKEENPTTIANYVFYKTFSHILKIVPPPRRAVREPRVMEQYRAVRNRDKRTLTQLLRKPTTPNQRGAIRGVLCQKFAENILPNAANRMYVDSDITNLEDRKALKANVAEIANWIFFGFRSQLDQLNWMDKESKTGAFGKLDNLQLNVAFPDWVTEDDKLTAFYKDLDYTEQDNFMNIVLKFIRYEQMQEVLPLVEPKPRDRGDFGSFIGITNAWYQPQMNSITFPEGILQEPFYSPDYPLATIFGGLGSISGHELTHGFDDQGVQWDGIGALDAWMTEKSQKSFDSMAQCVIDEYSSFCPFDDVCLNGENTQGENIADNGGIQAAYKALKAYESLNGADPRLPGFGSSFTSDQLFFLTFAQTWCDADETKAGYIRAIDTDVHSPAYYRVLGTIQNFPAFKNAFNCPANTPYTPDKHCDVWTSKPF